MSGSAAGGAGAAGPPLRLLFLAKGFPPELGGVERYNWELCRHLARLGHQVEVLVVQQPERPDPSGTGFALAPQQPGPGLSDEAALAAALARQPQAVLVSRASKKLEGLMAILRRSGVPTFPFAHGLRGHEVAKGRLRRWLKQRVLGFDFAPAVFANSGHTAARLREFGIPAANIDIVYPGIDAEGMQRDPVRGAEVRRRLGLEGRRVLVTVARLARNKRIDWMIDLMPRLLERVPEAHYLVVGGGEAQAELEAQAARLGLAERVTLAGPQPDPVPYYSAADVYAMISSQKSAGAHAGEGFGMVYAEAGACGLPCVASAEGGIPEVIEHGRTGLLVDPEQEAQVVDALVELLSRPERAEELGRAAREHVVTRFSWAGSAGVIERRVRSCLAAR